LGHFFGAMRIDAFRSKSEFKQNMDNWIKRFKNTSSVDGKKVLIPGEPEREMELVRKKNGIPLNQNVVNDLNEVGQKFGISLEA
ncbi:MAG: Ldh family oxidoreductase, partial [Bacteroidota bacterium]